MIICADHTKSVGTITHPPCMTVKMATGPFSSFPLPSPPPLFHFPSPSPANFVSCSDNHKFLPCAVLSLEQTEVRVTSSSPSPPYHVVSSDQRGKLVYKLKLQVSLDIPLLFLFLHLFSLLLPLPLSLSQPCPLCIILRHPQILPHAVLSPEQTGQELYPPSPVLSLILNQSGENKGC